MSSRTLLLLALVAIVVYFLMMPPTKIQEPTAEYFTVTPDPEYSNTVTVVTPDEISSIISLTQDALSKQIKQCTYCIETTHVSLSGNTYTGAFLFMVLTGYPYGISVISTVQKGPNGPESVSSIQLQNQNTIDDIDSFDQFTSASEIQTEDTLPHLADLQSALNNS